MSNLHCDLNKTHHKYLIKLECKACDRQGTSTRIFLCLRPDPRMREVGCKSCENSINMIFKCHSGGFDDDFWHRPEGSLFCRVENIDG